MDSNIMLIAVLSSIIKLKTKQKELMPADGRKKEVKIYLAIGGRKFYIKGGSKKKSS